MRGTQPRLRHLVGAATLTGSLFAALLFASLPAGAQPAPATAVSCPVLSVANPAPGGVVGAGDYVVSGAAWDPAASSGSGISAVSLFIGPRDLGGQFLGSAVPGLGDNPRAFSVTVTLPDNIDAQTTFNAYALSSVSGRETSVSFPVFIGVQPRRIGDATPTPVPTDVSVTTTCPRVNAIATAVSPSAPVATATSMVAPASVPAPQTSSTNCPVLTLGNPQPGDRLTAGDVVISGGAFLAGGSPAPGVTRVDLFLGARDAGGTYLGTGIPGQGSAGPTSWSATVTIPDLGRGQDFAAYAIGTNGQQTSIVFPVFVGAPNRTSGATPTPVPQTVTISNTCH
jgi:hypothetical protein